MTRILTVAAAADAAQPQPVSLAGIAILLVFALAAATVYFAACWVHPWRNCRHCGGSNKHRGRTGTTYRKCRHCRGADIPRIGTRIMAAASPSARARLKDR